MNGSVHYVTSGAAITLRTFTSNLGIGLLWTGLDTVNSWLVAPFISEVLVPMGVIGDLAGTTYQNLITLVKLNMWNALAQTV